jgi:hypothetical protein
MSYENVSRCEENGKGERGKGKESENDGKLLRSGASWESE